MSNDSHSVARHLCRILRKHGFSAYLAGGCVRDRLLSLPIKDCDIATSAQPVQIQALFPQTRQVGAHFGVCLVRHEGIETEVATFRSDHSYLDGRHPESVTWETDPQQDVQRRDFTINGLLEDPDTGDVLDYVGGLPDLKARIIRAIGDPAQRFAEDHLRLLRAVRFAARLGFVIEPATWQAMREHGHSIGKIAAERVRDELTRILTEGGAAHGFRLLDEAGLLEPILPEVTAMKGVAQPPEFHPEGDVWVHTLLLLENLQRPSATLAWGALLHDAGKPPTFRMADRIRFDGHAELGADMAEAILRRLKFSQDETAVIVSLVRNHLRFKDAPQMKESTLKRFFRLPRFDEQLELHRLDCISSHRRLENYWLVRQKWVATPAEQIRPVPLVRGDDLIALGLRPGPPFKQILEQAEEQQLEGSLTTREEALAWLKRVCSEAST